MIKYFVEVEGCTPAIWRVRKQFNLPGYGRPTEKNLAKYVMDYIDSLKIGGVNQHISKALGQIPVPNWAKIRENGDGRVVATWKAPMFMEI